MEDWFCYGQERIVVKIQIFCEVQDMIKVGDIFFVNILIVCID